MTREYDYTAEADLREARAEISRHHELIKQMREGIQLLYSNLRKPARTGEDWDEVATFMSWFHRNVG